jgi:hypothetical protein
LAEIDFTIARLLPVTGIGVWLSRIPSDGVEW